MTDADFLRALENCELPEREFAHSAHVRTAYLYLQGRDFSAALERVRLAIRAYAAHLGRPDLYHETITVAYVALIQQHRYERGNAGGWPAFAQANPELLDTQLLRRFYPAGELNSDMARRIFLLPKAWQAQTTPSAEPPAA